MYLDAKGSEMLELIIAGGQSKIPWYLEPDHATPTCHVENVKDHATVTSNVQKV